MPLRLTLKFTAALALCLACGVAAQAQSLNITSLQGGNSTATITYGGMANGVTNGLTNNFSFNSQIGDLFTFTITNTTSINIGGAITGIAFNLPTAESLDDTFVLQSSTPLFAADCGTNDEPSPCFNISQEETITAGVGPGGVPVDFVLYTGNNNPGNNFQSGRVADGIPVGIMAGGNMVSFSIFSQNGFSGLSAAEIAGLVYVRFQGISDGNLTSDVAAVPEPTTLLLLGISVVGTGVAALRRRRKAGEVEE